MRARGAAKPTSSTSCVPRRAWNTARRRPSPWASTRSATGASRPACAQRFDDELALPGAVGGERPVLHGAAAADAEMRADRSDALGARRVDVQEVAAIGMARRRRRPRPSRPAGRRARRLGRRRVGDAVAAMAERVDRRGAQPRARPDKNSRLPSPPAIGEGTTPTTCQPSAATNAAISSHTAAWTAGSRTMPFLTCAAPGLELRLDQRNEARAGAGELAAPAAARASAR